MRNPTKKLRLAKKSELPTVVQCREGVSDAFKREGLFSRRAGGLLLCGEIDGRAFFDLRLEHG